jgi:hypothetical protein
MYNLSPFCIICPRLALHVQVHVPEMMAQRRHDLTCRG